MKKIKLLVASVLLSALISTTTFAGEWKQDDTGWWYQNDDGSYPTDEWMQDNGKWYLFDSNGYMRTGWVQDADSKWYYLNTSGDMQTEPIISDTGITYNFNADGSCSNPYDGMKDQYYYNYTDGVEKNIANELAVRDYIGSISGNSGSMFGNSSSTSTHTLKPDTIITEWNEE